MATFLLNQSESRILCVTMIFAMDTVVEDEIDGIVYAPGLGGSQTSVNVYNGTSL